jgi:hypothetical protein
MVLFLIMQKSIAAEHEATFTIRFKTKEDRTKGIAALFRSKLPSIGNGDDFLVKQPHIDILENKNIKYTRIS